MRIQWTRWGVMGAAAAASVAIAGTLMQLDAPLEVSTAAAANSAYKAKMGWQSYMSDAAGGKAAYDVKVQLLVYSDGPADAQDIWVARSTDNGATWAQTNVTNNGGTPFNVTDPVSGKTGTFSVNHYKANIYVAPVGVLNGGKGANALLSWTSSDCEGSPAQRINANLVPLTGKNQPFSCLWTARSTNGGLTWTTQRLTDGGMDADNDVLGGSVKYTNETSASGYFAVAFQADPEGLQLGEAEGTGDGASGANVSPGTNIWYSHLSKSAFEAGTRFPPPVQVSDNNANAEGSPGASRPMKKPRGMAPAASRSSITASRPTAPRWTACRQAPPSATRRTMRGGCALWRKATKRWAMPTRMATPPTAIPWVCMCCCSGAKPR
jgi:hypothetical protein